MDGTQFALPTISAADMPKDDQGALIVNQATAIIVKAYLDNWHAQWAALTTQDMYVSQNTAEKFGFADDSAMYQARQQMIMRPADLQNLVDSVQNALKQF